jgi:adenylosuccinate lyase
MIPRYTNPEMADLWSDQSRYQIWLDIERYALEGLVKVGEAPAEALEAYNAKATFSVERVNELELQVKHDVIAFLTNVAEHVGPLSRYVHKGMTSSDVVDTCLAVQMRRSGLLLKKQLELLMEAIETRAIEFKDTPCIGRSHGIHAEPTTFGVKLAGWYAELKRQHNRLQQAIETISVGKLSGAVGVYGGINPQVEELVMSRLELRPETVATQVVARDRHAEFMGCLAQIGSSIERFSVEIRHLQRTEVREVMEGFTPGQKGSSAMPHKRNPILTENLCGLARLLRGYAQACFENVALWHERDISHSSVERVAVPDACIALDFMLRRFKGVVSNLVVSAERMLSNLEMTRGTVFSGHLLLALVDAGMTREDAYALVQKHALAAFDGGASLFERAKTDPVIEKTLPGEKLAAIFDLRRYLKEVNRIVDRALRED